MNSKSVWFALSILLVSCGKATVDTSRLVQTTATSAASESETSVEKVVTLFSDATGATMTNCAAIGTEIPNVVSRMTVDFTGASMVRAQFASSLTSALIFVRIEYSTDGGSTWSDLVDDFAAGTVANQMNVSAWTSIAGIAQASVIVRAVIVGNGVLDPVIRFVRIGYY